MKKLLTITLLLFCFFSNGQTKVKYDTVPVIITICDTLNSSVRRFIFYDKKGELNDTVMIVWAIKGYAVTIKEWVCCEENFGKGFHTSEARYYYKQTGKVTYLTLDRKLIPTNWIVIKTVNI